MTREGDENAQNDTHIFRLKLEEKPNSFLPVLHILLDIRAAAFSVLL